MVQKKKEVKSTSASSKKRKLSDTSLDWITDTIESDAIFEGQAENIQSKSAEVSKESKIGVFKHYESEEVEKKKDEKPEEIPAILGSSPTITKGEGITPAKKEEAQKTEVIEIEEDKEKAISAEETPVEIGKTYKITKEKKLFLAEEEEKTVSVKKEIVPDGKNIPPEYEVKKEEVIPEKKIVREEPYVHIPEDSTSIVKKKTDTAFKEKVISGEDKIPYKEKKTTVAAKEEVPPSEKRKWMRMSSIGGALIKGGKKVSGTVAKPFKSDKKIFRKSVNAAINISKQPGRAISAVDRKITHSMKKVVLWGDPGNSVRKKLNNIQKTDTGITKSTKKWIDSMLG